MDRNEFELRLAKAKADYELARFLDHQAYEKSCYWLNLWDLAGPLVNEAFREMRDAGPEDDYDQLYADWQGAWRISDIARRTWKHYWDEQNRITEERSAAFDLLLALLDKKWDYEIDDLLSLTGGPGSQTIKEADFISLDVWEPEYQHRYSREGG